MVSIYTERKCENIHHFYGLLGYKLPQSPQKTCRVHSDPKVPFHAIRNPMHTKPILLKVLKKDDYYAILPLVAFHSKLPIPNGGVFHYAFYQNSIFGVIFGDDAGCGFLSPCRLQ